MFTCSPARTSALATLALMVVSIHHAALFPCTAFAGAPRVTLTPGGGAVRLPDELGVERTRPLVGGIIGITFSPRLAFELRGTTYSAQSDTASAPSFEPLHLEGNLTWFWSRDHWLVPYVTGGASAVRVENETAAAANYGGGILFRFSPTLGIRMDARDVLFDRPNVTGDDRHHTWELFAGLTFGLGASVDTDFDGVADKRDQCPGTPRGARVDVSGCPIDGDVDGIPDGLDQCPGTPPGATVDGRGCPSDEDRDTILDGIDTCAGTPFGARVDPAGCPYDADRDSIFDGIDQCEGTPFGCTVDPIGCPLDTDRDGVCDGLDHERETELLETGMIRLQNVNFVAGKAVIDPASFRALDEVAAILARWPELRIEIGGHTDAAGSTPQNQALSEARARAVLDYMMTKFPDLEADRFRAVGYGEKVPLADNASQLGRAKNRRVEFKVDGRAEAPATIRQPGPSGIRGRDRSRP